MNHKYHETFHSTCSLKQIIRRILTSDQPLQRLWKVKTFSIFISFFFGNFVTLKKTANGGWCYQAGALGILDCMVLYVTPIRLGLSC